MQKPRNLQEFGYQRSRESRSRANPGLVEVRVLDRLANQASFCVTRRAVGRQEITVARVQRAVPGLDDRRVVILASLRIALPRDLPRRPVSPKRLWRGGGSRLRRRRIALEVPCP